MTAEIRTVVSGVGYSPAAATVLPDSLDTGRICDATDGRTAADPSSVRATGTAEQRTSLFDRRVMA
ncbi:hypothetical protein [Haladaptatus sp. DYF46]|uniref:hypothetical protein n=1 Tax=Haladaptatus sp. DYF46 TaxID=2886041 RepID=UPI001E4969D2|nr:hypothetical protein [Haladaptatus sp. DYF46]